MDRADVGERARLRERVRTALVLVDRPGVEAPVLRRGGVGSDVLVRPGDRVADVDARGARGELEVLDGDAGRGSGGHGRMAARLRLRIRGVPRVPEALP